ncbi:hypothetical protein TWF730_007705 [Orbilia blumenaviensis]|uniref:Uncharacterized protein n=1 Tax=Orbilia blumenaviensis TaxID=1796055 RepID=A0AAV9VBC0_9PEZI
MKPTFVHSFLCLAAGIRFADAYAYAAGCNADNCARGVTGTAVRIPISQRAADCSKFMGAMGPAPTTITTTVMKTVVVSSTVGTRTETQTSSGEEEEETPTFGKVAATDGKADDKKDDKEDDKKDDKEDDKDDKDDKPAEGDAAKDTTDAAKNVDDTPAAADEKKADKLRRRSPYGNDEELAKEAKPAPATTPAPKPATTGKEVPEYASHCSGSVRYSSACSCWGIRAGSASPSTETEVVTKTTTSVVQITAVVKKMSIVCSKTQEKCGETCKNVFTDTKNCGACDVKCKDGASCIHGVCTEPACEGVGEWQCNNESKKGCNGGTDHETFCMKGVKGSFCTSFANLPLCPRTEADGCKSDDECGKGQICGHIACCGWNICIKPHFPDPIGGPLSKAAKTSRLLKRENKLRLRSLAQTD